ncbi:unnamed protein product [Trifolium pratense]|uniref:Uncharacterized protein n=1 Tax=Trifolium pratense TaxID=57577 RepID=A0ACB0JLN0_TRIPR|nr:unnamed protein product [Trifolium pratense]
MIFIDHCIITAFPPLCLCREKGLAALQRAWWILFKQLETLAVQAWDGLVEIDKMNSANYAAVPHRIIPPSIGPT